MGRRKLPPPAKTPALPPDWPWIKRQYRIGMKSTREIARESSDKGRKISHVAIEKRAKKEGWTRDLKKDVLARVGAELAVDAVNAVNRHGATDEEVIDAAAMQGVEVVRSHRRSIQNRRHLSDTLLQELTEASAASSEVDALLPPLAADANAKDKETWLQRRERLMKAIGLQARVSIFKDLVQADRHLIGLERTAFNLNDSDAAPDSIEDRLAKLEDAK